MSNIVLTVPKGARKNKKRLGRGGASGTGCTAGKGSKGQNARAGGGVRPGFEGGQMPLYRRIARRGFSNAPFKKEYLILNIDDLDVFKSGETVSRESLLKQGLISKRTKPVKLLGRGEIKKKLVVEVDKVSKQAREKITGAGGEVKELALRSRKEQKRGLKKSAAPVQEKAAPKVKAETVEEKPAKTAPKVKKEAAAEKPKKAAPKTKTEPAAEEPVKTVFREKTEPTAEKSAGATPKTVMRAPAKKPAKPVKQEEAAEENADAPETESKDKE